MHHKPVIVDRDEVATGSYTFSNNAEHQTLESLVSFEPVKDPQLVQSFADNFTQIWDTGRGGGSSDLLDVVRGNSPSVPIVFDFMALTWGQVTALKGAIRDESTLINSEPYRTRPQSHEDCSQ